MMNEILTKIASIIAGLGLIFTPAFIAPSDESPATGDPGTITMLNQWKVSGDSIQLSSTTASLRVPSLVSCDTIDTDGNGVFFCGTDSGGAGSQTPWTANINGAGYSLSNAGRITATYFTATSTTATSTFREFSFTNATGTNLSVTGSSSFSNLNVASGTVTTLLATNATSTTIAATTATSTSYFGAGLTGCNGVMSALTWLGGSFGCNTIPSSGGNVSTSTTEVQGNLAYWTTNGATPAKLGTVATGTLSGNDGLTGSATVIGGSSNIGLAAINANSVLGNNTGASAVPTSVSTSSLYAALANGNVLGRVNGGWTGVATTTAGTGLTYTGSAFNVNTSQNIATLSNLTSDGFVMTSGGVGTLGVQTLPCTMAQGCTGLTTNASGTVLFGKGTGWIAMASSSLGVALGDTTGVLAATRGGTGLSSIASSSLLIGGAGNTWLQFATSSLNIDLSNTTGTLGVTRGGTGQTTSASSSILFGGTGNTTVYMATSSIKIAATDLTGNGAGGTTLTMANGVPSWIATTTFSAPLVFANGNVTCTSASSGVTGCLTGTDWNTFNGKQNTISVTYPITLSGATVGIAFGTTTNNIWSGTNAYTGNVAHGTSSPWIRLSVVNTYGSQDPLFDVATTTSANGAATSSIFRVTATGTLMTLATTSQVAVMNSTLNQLMLGGGTTQSLTSLAAGTNGRVLAMALGVPTYVATTTFSSPLIYSGGDVSCQTASGSLAGCLSSTDWTTFNGKLGDTWLHQSNFGLTMSATNTPIWIQSGGGLYSSSSAVYFNQATSTFFYAQYASSSFLYGASLASCNGASNALTWSNGSFGCNTIVGGAGGDPFSHVTAFGTTTSATSSALWAKVGIFASSTSYFDDIVMGTSTIASTSPYSWFNDQDASANSKFGFIFFHDGQFEIGTSTDSRSATTSLFTIANSTTTVRTSKLVVGSGSNTSTIDPSSGTSTFNGGVNLPTSGCYAVLGTCIGSGGTLTGSGVANRGAFWTSANNLSYTDNFTWDNTNFRMGIGTTSPYAKLSVVGETVSAFYTATTSATSTFAGGLTLGTAGAWGGLNVNGFATSTFANGINVATGCFAVNGTCLSGGSTSAVGGTGAVQFANGTAFNGNTSELYYDEVNNRFSMGSSTPMAHFTLVANNPQPEMLVATSSGATPFFFLDATTTDVWKDFARVIIGQPSEYIASSSAVSDSQFLSPLNVSRINTGDWISLGCKAEHAKKTAVNTGDLTGSVLSTTLGYPCGDFSYIEDTAGVSEYYNTIGSGYTVLKAGTAGIASAAGDGMGLALTTAFMNIATNTPVFETSVALANIRTNAMVRLGFTSDTGVAPDYGTQPASGVYFVASSTQANWWYVCTTGSATTTASTGVATSTIVNGVGTSTFMRFAIQVNPNLAIFYIQKGDQQNFAEVGRCTTNIPVAQTSFQTLNPTVSMGSVSAQTLSSPALLVKYISMWYRDPLWTP